MAPNPLRADGKTLRNLTPDELLDTPRIEHGELGTQVLLKKGALSEIRRRLKMLEKKFQMKPQEIH